MLKLLFIGDVVGQPGREIVAGRLPRLREEHGLDFVIANGENAAGGSGLTAATARSLLEEYPLDMADGLAHVEAVAKALSTFGHEARNMISEADELDDADTADLFTEISRGIDKWLWFVEAHSQAPK